MDIDEHLNLLSNEQDRLVLRKIFEQLIADLNASKAIFDAHTHRTEGIQDQGFNAVTFAIDAAPQDVQTSVAFDFCIAGIAYQLPIQAAIDISAVAGYTPTALATAFQRYYLFHVGADLAIGITEGVAHATAAVIPATPAGKVAFGLLKIVNTSVGNYTCGTTLMDVAGITETFADLCGNTGGGQEMVISKPGSDTQEIDQGTATVLVQTLTL